MEKQKIMNSRSIGRLIAGTLLTAVMAIGSLTSGASVKAVTGSTVTKTTPIEVLVPLTLENAATLTDNQTIYLDTAGQLEEGLLALQGSACVTYTTAESGTNPDAPGWDGTACESGYSLSYVLNSCTYSTKLYVLTHHGRTANGFDECPAGLLATNDGNSWYYYCCGGAVGNQPVTPFIVSTVDAEVTVTMKDDMYKLVDGQPTTIGRDDIVSITYAYSYTDLSGVAHDYTGNLDQFTVTDGKIQPGDDQIDIRYGLGCSMKISVPVAYEIKFDLMGGTTSASIENQYIKYNCAIAETAVEPTKEGFKFLGWSTEPGGAVCDLAAEKVTECRTYYAVWGGSDVSKKADIISEDAIVETAGINNDPDELAEALMTEEEKKEMRTGVDGKIYITVDDISDAVTDTDKTKIEGSLENSQKIIAYLDINLFKQVGNNNPVQITNTTGNKISISFGLPESLVIEKTNIERTYYIARLHNGEVELIPVVYDPVNRTITFETDKFSIYAIVYKDVTKEVPTTAATTAATTVASTEATTVTTTEATTVTTTEATTAAIAAATTSPKTGDSAHTAWVLGLLFGSLIGLSISMTAIRGHKK